MQRYFVVPLFGPLLDPAPFWNQVHVVSVGSDPLLLLKAGSFKGSTRKPLTIPPWGEGLGCGKCHQIRPDHTMQSY